MYTKGRCDDPLLPITDDSVMAVDYRNVALNGTVVTLTCPPGRMLNGPKSVMCTQTGQWEPNPSTVNCSAAEFEDATISGKRYTCDEAGLPIVTMWLLQ